MVIDGKDKKMLLMDWTERLSGEKKESQK